MRMSDNAFKLKEDVASQKNCQNPSKFDSHKATLSGEFDSWKDSHPTRLE